MTTEAWCFKVGVDEVCRVSDISGKSGNRGVDGNDIPASASELSNALVAERTHILTATLQNLEERLSRRAELWRS